ncbi:hypothetical protein PB01_12855 [Psychrobacillus glaciei]|uniref:Lipoprotein n=1 Tax=Psychrobacillus glaciei TaxID=2283160 RepID=A0A5J6SNY0_9BACI|nr:hypothetical protein [Psychrobacillus glaciei]QFF99651.1 hypothetical protein PB01_12855 [Psychrobacillus glaciei]
MKLAKVPIVYMLIVILTGCNSLESKTLTQLYKGQFVDVDQMIILDGTTGHQKIVSEKVVIDEFLEKIKDIQFIPEDNQETEKGFRYGITLMEGEKSFTFTMNQVNNHNYYTEPDMYPIVVGFYTGLDIQ